MNTRNYKFGKVSLERFGKLKASGLGSIRGTSSGRYSCLKRYGFFILWFIFHSRGCLVEF